MKLSGATGGHFKEACLINQSLTALGRVIMELVDAQCHKNKGHIPYRDSRLTFLLQVGKISLTSVNWPLLPFERPHSDQKALLLLSSLHSSAHQLKTVMSEVLSSM